MDIKESFHNKLQSIREGTEQLDELSDPTHMSYRAKSRNELDKMINRLGSKMGSDTVNVRKMKNRADGIKKSYKLQSKKKPEEEQQNEDYDYVAKYWKDEYASLTNAKPSRPGDKRILRGFKKDASDNAKIAVTGVDHRKKSKKYIGEEEQLNERHGLTDDQKKQLDEVTKEFALDASRKAEKAGFEADSLADRMSNAANTFGKTREQQDDLDRKASEARKKSKKKFKQQQKFREYAAKKKLDESSPEKIGRYISKASKQKKKIQDKAYADKLEKGDLPKFEKRKRGVQLAIKKLTGQAKVPAK